jgi:hypothetical protein
MAGTNGEKPQGSIEDISDVFLACRDFGHAWRPHDVRIDRKYKEIHRVFSCLHNCGTERTQVLSPNGHIVRNFYTYPDGYVILGLGRLSIDDRAQIRVMGTNFLKAHGM